VKRRATLLGRALVHQCQCDRQPSGTEPVQRVCPDHAISTYGPPYSICRLTPSIAGADDNASGARRPGHRPRSSVNTVSIAPSNSPCSPARSKPAGIAANTPPSPAEGRNLTAVLNLDMVGWSRHFLRVASWSIRSAESSHLISRLPTPS